MSNIEELRAMFDWKPISTKPKNRRIIVLCDHESGTEHGWIEVDDEKSTEIWAGARKLSMGRLQ